MKTAAPTTFPARLGRTLGRAWRGCARMDRRAKGWLLAQGWALNVVKTVLLVVKLTVIGILFYTAFWLTALLTVVAISGAWAARSPEQADAEECVLGDGDQADHKQSVFYDPINYDDDPDPRFHDER
jgi:hypothetical protein